MWCAESWRGWDQFCSHIICGKMGPCAAGREESLAVQEESWTPHKNWIMSLPDSYLDNLMWKTCCI